MTAVATVMIVATATAVATAIAVATATIVATVCRAQIHVPSVIPRRERVECRDGTAECRVVGVSSACPLAGRPDSNTSGPYTKHRATRFPARMTMSHATSRYCLYRLTVNDQSRGREWYFALYGTVKLYFIERYE